MDKYAEYLVKWTVQFSTKNDQIVKESVKIEQKIIVLYHRDEVVPTMQGGNVVHNTF